VSPSLRLFITCAEKFPPRMNTCAGTSSPRGRAPERTATPFRSRQIPPLPFLCLRGKGQSPLSLDPAPVAAQTDKKKYLFDTRVSFPSSTMISSPPYHTGRELELHRLVRQCLLRLFACFCLPSSLFLAAPIDGLEKNLESEESECSLVGFLLSWRPFGVRFFFFSKPSSGSPFFLFLL